MINKIKRLFKREIQSQYSDEYIEILVLNADLDDCLQRAERAEALLKHRDTLLVKRLEDLKNCQNTIMRTSAMLEIYRERRIEDLATKVAEVKTVEPLCGYCQGGTCAEDMCETCWQRMEQWGGVQRHLTQIKRASRDAYQQVFISAQEIRHNPDGPGECHGSGCSNTDIYNIMGLPLCTQCIETMKRSVNQHLGESR